MAVGPATTVLKSSTRTPVSGGGKKLKIAQRYPVIYRESIMTTPTGEPEDRARSNIDRLLTDSGWIIQNRDGINIEAGRGIAIREFVLAPGHGFADYLLYVDGCAAGVVEAKKAGVPLTEVELQTDRYSVGLPANLPAPRRHW